MALRSVPVAVLLTFGLVSTALADTVYFKSGATLSGKVTMTGDKVRVESGDGTLLVASSLVEKITRPAPSAEETAPEQQLQADADQTPGTRLRPRVRTVASGVRVDVRPIVCPSRRYVCIGLSGWRASTPTWQTFTVRTPSRRARARRARRARR